MGTVNYYLKDAHGDTAFLVDAAGEIAKNYIYDAFGNEQYTMADSNPFRYCGEYADRETGLLYLRNRYYDPSTGRFISEDPVRDGLNWYVYCASDPVNRIDPSGLVDSMLRYIIEKNGETVSFDSDTGSTIIDMPGFKPMTLSSISSTGKATVSVEGQDDFEIDARVINGRTVVDSQFFMDNFGLSQDQATHQSNDSFSSLDEAIVGFGLTYYPKSQASTTWTNGCEYGTFLYDNGTFSFGNVPAAIMTNTCDLGALDTSRGLVGWIHTHPNPGVGYVVEEFSGNAGGSGDGAATNLYNVPGYLVAPSGTIFGLNSAWKGVNVNIIPANDPNVFIQTPNLF